ncbi:predicted protein [Naegleria gruberi]|uniref:Predicted protein n=1 Tax=Naegleria gruberi TaxID=5762 RepID=D2VAD7_NAEGR|nr:uncharacterized protein NAEGRDRAFT_65824 [Naegleria gruberi]EFC46412.1 predicted protein [Naegleria gruberi]|eukprot:XP_002679156.1 predicted protein [Naegleria gruberi strain NEG-M]
MSSNEQASWQQNNRQLASSTNQPVMHNNNVSNNFQLVLLPFFEQLTNMYFTPTTSSNILSIVNESQTLPNETSFHPQESETLSTVRHSSNSSEKKRKHKSACVYCNKLHKKCDGEAPNSCTRCKSKGISCAYLPPQKRGPKKRKSSSSDDLENSDNVTNHEIAVDEKQSNNSIDQFNENHSQAFPITSLYSSPLSGLQFNVTTQTRTLMNQFLDCVTCHSLVDGPMLDQCLNSSLMSPINHSPDPYGFHLLLNIVCAMGAQRLEDRKNCVDFFNRARSQASYLFDHPSREASCALSLMGVYACSEGERVKSHMYNRIALEMSSSICSYQVEDDKFYQALSALSFANSISKFLAELGVNKLEEIEKIDENMQKIVEETSNYLTSSKCTRKIEQLERKISEMSLIKGSEEISFTATLVYYLLYSRVAYLSNNQTELIGILRKLETLEKYIESDKFQKHDIQKNVHRFCLYSLRADILVRCGLEKMGLHCATMASGLASRATFWKSAPFQIRSVEKYFERNDSIDEKKERFE